MPPIAITILPAHGEIAAFFGSSQSGHGVMKRDVRMLGADIP
jgi:hypothetical protein